MRAQAWILVAALAASAACSPVDPEEGHLVILHTNDVHGQARPRRATWLGGEDPPLIGGLPRLAAAIRGVREEVGEERVILVDGGDWSQGTPEGLVDEGAAFVEAMVAVGYDALCVGNHELDHGVESFVARLQTAGVPAVLANVRDASGERVDWAPAVRVFERGGLRVAVVGLLTPVTPSITHADAKAVRFADPAEELGRVLEELGDSVDLVIPATHLGVDDDRELARAHPDLVFIAGGHSHTFLREGVLEGDVLIGQVGSKASAYGRLDLWFDPVTKEVLRREYEVISLMAELVEGESVARVDELCAALVAESDAVMSEVVGELAAPLDRARSSLESSAAGNLITDAMVEHFGADCAFQNRGGIRCDLPQGPVTRRDLFEILPFGNHLVLIELRGEPLLGTLRQAVEGTAHTGLEVSGLTLIVKEGDPPKLESVLVGGEALDPERVYRVVTNSFLADGGDNYILLGEVESLSHDPTLLRELLEQRFAGGAVTPATDDRYRVQ